MASSSSPLPSSSIELSCRQLPLLLVVLRCQICAIKGDMTGWQIDRQTGKAGACRQTTFIFACGKKSLINLISMQIATSQQCQPRQQQQLFHDKLRYYCWQKLESEVKQNQRCHKKLHIYECLINWWHFNVYGNGRGRNEWVEMKKWNLRKGEIVGNWKIKAKTFGSTTKCPFAVIIGVI